MVFFIWTSRTSKIAKHIWGNRVDLGALENLMSQKGHKSCSSQVAKKRCIIFVEKNKVTKK